MSTERDDREKDDNEERDGGEDSEGEDSGHVSRNSFLCSVSFPPSDREVEEQKFKSESKRALINIIYIYF